MFKNLAVAATIALAASSAMAEEVAMNMVCSSTDSIAAMLDSEREAPVFTGDAVILATNGARVEGLLVFTMNRNNAFTVIFSPAGSPNIACMLTAGQNAKAVN